MSDFIPECEHCGKRCYGSRRHAKAARRAMPGRRGLRAYRCLHDGTRWHLGHLPQATVWGFKTTREIYRRAA